MKKPDMDVLEFARRISMLSAETPLSDAFDKEYGQTKNRWWSCQREHMTVWCLHYPTEGVEDYRHNPRTSASYMYYHYGRPETLLWLIEALTVTKKEPFELEALIEEIKGAQPRSACGIIREKVPFKTILKWLGAEESVLQRPTRIEELVQQLKDTGRTIATAESCTGGLLGKSITDVSGSSAVYPGGVISYCNRIKHAVLGVDQEDLDSLGPVSATVARQMAEGVRRVIGADLGVSVTGIAGPNSDETGRPVGLVYIGASDGMTTLIREYRFDGDRAAVRAQAAEAAAELAMKLIEN